MPSRRYCTCGSDGSGHQHGCRCGQGGETSGRKQCLQIVFERTFHYDHVRESFTTTTTEAWGIVQCRVHTTTAAEHYIPLSCRSSVFWLDRTTGISFRLAGEISLSCDYWSSYGQSRTTAFVVGWNATLAVVAVHERKGTGDTIQLAYSHCR